MASKKTLDQHIAVFGESGSGKTVLLSSFYGATQEPDFEEQSFYRIVADDIGQGNKLHKNYLGMQEDSRTPIADRFSAKTYTFSLKLKSKFVSNGPVPPVEALKLIWHDYPGEWFDHAPSNELEERRRIETFSNLLHSDVALILVDSQRLIDNKGEEERYLKSLISTFKNSLLGLQDGLLEDGSRKVKFPRIWMFALSKCDLLPEYDVYDFRNLLIRTVTGEIDELRQVITEFIDTPEALSVGEDFVLLSSARFESGNIELGDRVGVDLVLPLASALPFQRHLRWARAKTLPAQVAKELLRNVKAVAGILRRYQHKLPGRVQKVLDFISPEALDSMADLAGAALEEAQKTALEKRNYFAAILNGFRIDLEQAEQARTLRRSNQ